MRISLLGSLVDNLSMKDTIKKVDYIIKEGKPTQHVVINANKVVMMKKDSKLRKIVNESGIINADGVSILLAAKFLGKPLIERVTGIDLMSEVLNLADTKKYKVFFLGAEEEVVSKVVSKVQVEYPNLVVSGYRNGFFKPYKSDEIATNICDSKADILFVAFSSPEKEFWIKSQLDRMNVPFVMGVGGSFDVIAGKTRRAPKWIQNMGLEWLYRWCQEPIRLFNRYCIGNFKFFKLVIQEKLERKDSL